MNAHLIIALSLAFMAMPLNVKGQGNELGLDGKQVIVGLSPELADSMAGLPDPQLEFIGGHARAIVEFKFIAHTGRFMILQTTAGTTFYIPADRILFLKLAESKKIEPLK